MNTDKEGRPGERLRLVSSESIDSPVRLNRLARDLRECTETARWPDFARKLIEAAESLEGQAVEFEAGYSLRCARV
jgi:hypothetical protein